MEGTAKFVPTDHRRGAYFGRSIAVSGDTLVVGVPEARDLGVRTGAVNVYRRTGDEWHFETRLLPPDPTVDGTFGHSIVLDGEILLVGAPRSGKPHASGLAYVFQRAPSGWMHLATLAPSDPGEGDGFGKTIAMHGDFAFVGAEDDDVLGVDSGSVYVFRGLQSDCNDNGTLDIADLASCESTDCNGTGILDECESVTGGDFDADGVVRLGDFNAFFDCLGGPSREPHPFNGWCDTTCLRAFDFDVDGDVDMKDFSRLQPLIDH